MCAQHQLLEVPAGGRVFLNCANKGIGSRRYDNRITFLFPVPGGKEEISVFKMFTFVL